jgi:hypothetical protein
MTVLRYGDTQAREVSQRMAAPVANLAALAAFGIADAANGQVALDIATGKRWIFSAACALTADNQLVAGSGSGNGRWLLMPGTWVLTFPITFATADAAVLFTVPTGAVLQPEEFYWTISTSFTGGSSSAIGVSSAKTGYSTKGDLLGGATGDVLAGLTTALSPTMGTVGAGFDTLAKRRALWVATNTFRFDRITSVFTAGVGAVNAKVTLISNP